MSKIDFSPEARQDLHEIVDYIAEHNMLAAHMMKERIEAGCMRLVDMPLMGHKRGDLTDKPIRFWPIGEYLILDDPNAAPLRIIRILHGHRDVGNFL